MDAACGILSARGGGMSGQFKVGEVLVGQNLIEDTEYNGVECIVIVGPVPHVDLEGMGYEVEWVDRSRSWQYPHTLRRKQPPSGEQRVMDWFKLPAPSKAREVA